VSNPFGERCVARLKYVRHAQLVVWFVLAVKVAGREALTRLTKHCVVRAWARRWEHVAKTHRVVTDDDVRHLQRA
jgi:hypothetical protein